MSVERFLLFWSHNNQTIIQVLIVLTLLFIVALVFLTLFGSKDEFSEKGGSAQISPDLEKSLQRMLENQTQAKSAVFDFSKGEANAPVVSSAQSSDQNTAAHQEAVAQLEKVKAEVAAREKSIQELKTQLEVAQSAAQAAVPSASSSGLEARIKELEARLSEYDIISEDIADLSKFKEENEKLKKQLSQAASAPVAAAPSPAPAPKPVQMAPLPDLPPEPAGIPELKMEPAPAPVAAAPPLEVVPQPAAADPMVSSAIDDDLMKEFAAAVENQKAATAAKPPEAPPASAESEDLMGQFENFVQKKEGS